MWWCADRAARRIAPLAAIAGALALGALPLRPAGLAARSQASVEPVTLVVRAGSFLERHARIRPGESVLIVSDRSVDEAVRTAFADAAAKAGATVTELVLQGHPEITDGLEIARKMRFERWFPGWVWEAAARNAVVLELTSLGSGHIGGRPELPAGTRLVDVPFSRREQLADPMSRGHYPEEILETIARTVWTQIRGGQRFELTDSEGTNLRWTLDGTAWDEVKTVDPARNAEHLSLPAPFRSRTPDMRGWLVGSSTHSGPLPRVRLKIEGGRVVEVQDGRHVADYLRAMFASSRDVTFPGFPGPGSNWVEETTIGTHPRHTRVPGAERLGWQGEMAAWNGAPRAGVFHLAIGTSRSGRNFQFARQHGLEVQHLDVELYAPTLLVDGRAVISRGHLAALDDPGVRRVASRFGDANDLLRVTWVPVID